jgi:hypothetical protein
MSIRSMRRAHARFIVKIAAAGGVAASATLAAPLSLSAYGDATTTTSPQGAPQLPPLAPEIPQPTNPDSVIAAQNALDIQGTVSAAQSTFGDSYAGAWIDNSSGMSVIKIMVAGSSVAATKTFSNALPASASAHTSVSQVKYTYAQLQQFQSQIVAYMQSAFSSPGTGPSSWGLALDPIDNAVKVEISQADAGFVSQIQALVPADALRIEWRTGAQATDGPGWFGPMNADSFPPYKAGLEALASGNDCTSGFLMEIDGTYKGVIAGHCDTSNSKDYVFGNSTGTLGQGDGVYSFGSGGDYMVFELTQQAANEWIGRILAETTPPAHLGGNNPECVECYTPVRSASSFLDDVDGRVPDSLQIQGEMSCRAGIHSDSVSCARLSDPAGTVETYDNHTVGHMACATGYSVQIGDSGGPIYYPIAGNHGEAMGVTDLDISHLTNDSTCWTTIDTVLQGLTSTFGYPAYVVGADGSLY